MRKLGPVQQKILLLLAAGTAFSVTRTPRQQYRLLDSFVQEWKNIGKRRVERSVQGLVRSKLLDLKKQPDGTWKMVLTDHGKKRALYYKIESMEIQKPKQWDKKWRIVLFDVPEKRKGSRDALRTWIKKLGFIELQKSVFILPFDCRDEFDFIVEFLGIREYVRFVVANEVDNEEYLKSRFFS